MPQEFQVLRCFSCGTFQVHQVKKVLKFNCKVCGEKQSIKKVYGRGSGADCRKHVQKCNMLRCELDMATVQGNEGADSVNDTNCSGVRPMGSFSSIQEVSSEEVRTSNKWKDYLKQSNDDDDDDEMREDDYTTSRHQFNQVKKDNAKASRQRWKTWKQKKYGNYNPEERNVNSVDVVFQEQRTFKRNNYQNLAGQTNVIAEPDSGKPELCRNELKLVQRDTTDFLDTYQEQNQSSTNHNKLFSSAPVGNEANVTLTNQTSMNLFSSGVSRISNPPTTQRNNTSSSLSNKSKLASLNINKDVTKLSKVVTISKDPNLSIKQSRWSAFLGDDPKPESSDDSEESDEEYGNILQNLPNQQTIGTKLFHEEYVGNKDSLMEEEHKINQNKEMLSDATNIIPTGCNATKLYNGKPGISDINSVPPDQKVEKNIFNVDNDLESILNDDW